MAKARGFTARLGKADGAGRAIVELPGLRHYDVIGPGNKLAAADIVIYTPVIAIVIILQGIIQRQRATIGWIGVLRCPCRSRCGRIDIGSRSRGRCMPSSRCYGRTLTNRWGCASATGGWMVETEQERQAAHAQGNDEDGQECHSSTSQEAHKTITAKLLSFERHDFTFFTVTREDLPNMNARIL